MAMYHHDSRDTATAVNEAREYLRASVQKGATRAAQGLRRLQERVIVDSLTPLSDVKYALAPESGVRLNGFGITPQAFQQLCSRAELPVPFARKLLAHDNPLARNLALENLETLSAISDQTVMLRTVDGVAHGVLSDAYKRMDSKLIVGTCLEQFQDGQLLPIQCDLSDTRIYVRAVLPRIYGAEFNEALCFGLAFKTSDFGFSKVELEPYVERVWCSNTARMTLRLGQGFSRQHRGARLTEDTFALSEQTQAMHAMAMASEIRDAVRGMLSPESIETYVQAIGACFVEGQRGGKFEAEREIEKLVTARKLTEKNAKFVAEIYASNDRNVVPQLDGRWKLSQAIAYAAQHALDLDVDQRVDLEYLAGEIVESAPKNALPAYAH